MVQEVAVSPGFCKENPGFGRCGSYSAEAPDCLMIGTQRARSSATSLATAAGGCGAIISMPCAFIFSRTAGFWAILISSALSLATIGSGVFFGTAKPIQVFTM